MSEVHLPHLEDDDEDVPDPPLPADASEESTGTPGPPRRRFKLPRVPKFLLEVILISSGVFLGLAGEQWRESHHKRELATITLRGLLSELETNRSQVAAKKDYHLAKQKELGAFFNADPKQRLKIQVSLQGVQVVSFEHAAWDLSLANGSLANIDPELASSLAHTYNAEQLYAEFNQGFTQSMYIRPPTSSENREQFYGALYVYYSDIVDLDPQLLIMYDDLIPKIRRELRE
jgi:hypothetical protein